MLTHHMEEGAADDLGGGCAIVLGLSIADIAGLVFAIAKFGWLGLAAWLAFQALTFISIGLFVWFTE